MSALIVNTTKTEDGRNVYSFTSRGTYYSVIERVKGCSEVFEIFSERKNAAFGLQIKIMTLDEMKLRSKALKDLATLINF